MAHPYKEHADKSRHSKAGYMGKENNLDIPIMKKAGENNPKKLYSSSSSSMQFKKQSAADGMKRGGHVGKPKHHKPKVVIAAPASDPNAPPALDPSAMAAAGAGPSPAPAPMPPPGAMPPGQGPMKRGGKVSHSDEAEDRALIKKMVKPSARMSRGGKPTWQTAGAGSGPGRIQIGKHTKI